MPRQSHGWSVSSEPRRKRQRNIKRSNALNALEVAERQNPESVRIRQNRIGEVQDDSDDPLSRADVDQRSNKRRKVNDTRQNDNEVGLLDQEEDLASGSDDEGGRWHEGVQQSDEDSDIDSDEAFGASDEEMFADFTFRGSSTSNRQSIRKPTSTKPGRLRPANLNKDEEWQVADAFNENEESDRDEDGQGYEEEEEDDLGEDAIDLATALDMNLQEEREEAERLVKRSRQSTKSSRIPAEVVEEDESGSDDEDDESQLSVSDHDTDGDHTGLQAFVAGLDPDKPSIETRKHRPVRAILEKPSTFGLSSSKLSASDLAQYVTDPAQRKSLKMLQANEDTAGDNYKGGMPGKLSAPLAKRQQDKLDRAAAFDKSKETLDRWIETVKTNRRSDHVSFPLEDPSAMSTKNARQLPKVSQSAPQNELEHAIRNILEESGMGQRGPEDVEDQETAFETLKEKSIPIEDVRERRAQLRLARELMFREEIRAKRIKKIKSKAYRRVHRKERDKVESQQREQLAAAGLFNSDEEREKNDRRRAEERMGARHKESKWAKSVKQTGRSAWDDDARVGVSELARRDEELRRRIEGRRVESSDMSESESDSDLDAGDSETERMKLQQKLSRLESGEGKPSKLGAMAFMQRAEAARKAQNDEEVKQLQLSLSGEQESLIESGDESFQPAGRQKFGVNLKSAKTTTQKRPERDEFEAFLSEDEIIEPEVSHNQAEPTSTSMNSPHATQRASNERHQGNSTGKTKRREHVNPDKKKTRPSQAVEHGSDQPRDMDDYTSPSDTEDEAHTPPMAADNDKAALAASIFAGSDDVLRDFEIEKAQVVEEEGDQVVDNTLPGWGSWTGTGISKREQNKGKGRFLVTVPGVAPEKRKDAKLDKVIINEKRVKKNGKYLATELPHPFESRQQYERSLRLPMGPEWSTVNHFQDAIKPRVLLKQGTVIRPIAKPTV